MADVKPGKGLFRVCGRVAVVRTLAGGERYLYRGTVFDGAQVGEDTVKHLLAVGVVEKASARAASKPASKPAESKPAESKPVESKPAEPADAGEVAEPAPKK